MLTTIMDRIRVSLLRVKKVHYARRRIKNMRNSYCTITYVVQGELLKEERGAQYRVTSGDVMIHRPNTPVSIYSDQPGVHYYLNLDLQLAGKDLFEQEDLPGALRLSCPSAFEQSFERLLELWNQTETPLRNMQLMELTIDVINQLVEALAEQTNGGGSFVERLTLADSRDRTTRFHKIVEYMEAHSQESITSEQLARMVHMHPSAFQKAFKSIYGTTPKLMLRQIRLHRARLMLEDDENTLETIAHSCGYYDAAHFIRIFQQAYRQTPGDFRRDRKSIL